MVRNSIKYGSAIRNLSKRKPAENPGEIRKNIKKAQKYLNTKTTEDLKKGAKEDLPFRETA